MVYQGIAKDPLHLAEVSPLLGYTFVPLFSFGPGGLTFLLDWTCLAVPFSPKQFILSSSYAPDSSQVEDKRVIAEFNL
ncbi:MAG: hypothetical protein ACFFCZ_19215 [Promethearchaeota archaeon]